MTPQQYERTQAIAQRFIRELHRLESGDESAIESIAQMFAENGRLSNPMLEHEGKERCGRDDVAAFWRQYRQSFREIRSDFLEVTVNPLAAGLFWRSRGTDAMGEPVDYNGVSLLMLNEAGHIQRFQGYFDSRQMVRTAH